MTTRTYYRSYNPYQQGRASLSCLLSTRYQILTEQEIRDIVLRCHPSSRYKSEMTTQDFSYHEANLDELVAFAERLEEVDSGKANPSWQGAGSAKSETLA